MKNFLSDWSFPALVIASWFVTSAYTLTRLGEASQSHVIAGGDAKDLPVPNAPPVTIYVASAENLPGLRR
jgi:hypothetical protein